MHYQSWNSPHTQNSQCLSAVNFFYFFISILSQNIFNSLSFSLYITFSTYSLVFSLIYLTVYTTFCLIPTSLNFNCLFYLYINTFYTIFFSYPYWSYNLFQYFGWHSWNTNTVIMQGSDSFHFSVYSLYDQQVLDILADRSGHCLTTCQSFSMVEIAFGLVGMQQTYHL